MQVYKIKSYAKINISLGILSKLKSKIHNCIVTNHNVQYQGSILIDSELINAAKMYVNEKVQILSITTGERLETYIIEGEAGSKEIVINGPAAHKIKTGENIIILSYGIFEQEEAINFSPSIVFVDENNSLIN